MILDELQPIAGLNDSKKLSAKRREALFDQIRARALACCIAEASVEEIDRLNILQATMLAMRRAVEGLRLKPVKVLVDGKTVIDCMNPLGRWDYGPWIWPPVQLPGNPVNPSAALDASIAPEAFMDVMMVNGTPYPTVTVEPKAYPRR